MDEIWRSIKEAAELIPRDERTIRRWCGKGGPLHSIALRDQDGQWRIPQTWIDRWLADNVSEPAQDITAPSTIDQTVVLDAIRAEVAAAVQGEVIVLREAMGQTEARHAEQMAIMIMELKMAREELTGLRRPWWKRLLGK